jgi:hypothetical protein
LFDRNISEINSNISDKIVYYNDFLHYEKDDNLFVFLNNNNEIVILNDKKYEILTTDLTINYNIKEIHYKNDKKILEIISIKN